MAEDETTSDVEVEDTSTDDALAELTTKITEKILEILKDFITDPEIVGIIAPLVPALVALGVAEGEDAASNVLAGLTGNDPYPHWKTLIVAASPAGRIQIMETQRQRAIQDTLALIQRNERWKAVWDMALKILYAIIPILVTVVI